MTNNLEALAGSSAAAPQSLVHARRASTAPFRLAVLNSHPIQYFAPLYRQLAQQPDINLTVYYCSRQGLDSYIDGEFGQQVQWDIPLLDGYRARFLPNWRNSDRVGNALSLINPAIVQELWRERYDALWVHGHNYATYLLAIGAARAFGTPIFMRCETHLLLRRSKARRRLRTILMRIFYQRVCTVCLPIGQRNREFYRYHGVPAERLFLVPYTVDNTFFMKATDAARENSRTSRSQFGLPPNRPAILFAAKLTERKRPLDLLRAYEQLRQDVGEPILVFVGAGDQEVALREYAQAHQIPDVYFLGFRNQSELPEIYTAADIYVLPSVDEPWALTINEAMCASLPIVASSEIGAVADLVRNGYNGLLFDAGNINHLSTHLLRLTADQALRQQMGERSRAIVAEWNMDRAVQGIRAALQQTRQKRTA